MSDTKIQLMLQHYKQRVAALEEQVAGLRADLSISEDARVKVEKQLDDALGQNEVIEGTVQ